MAKSNKSSGAKELLRKLSPPMKATLVSELPRNESDWTWELKYDGFRALGARTGRDSALWSRNALDLGERFPEIAAAIPRLRANEAVVDGEIVMLDAEGIPRFQLLQGGGGEPVYYVFDLLWADGEDLRGRALEERRRMLEKLIGRRKTGVIRLAEQLSGGARAALERAAAEGHEGLIAKQRASRYENRRSKAWLKLKAINAQELAVVGFTPSKASDREVGSLILGYVEKGAMTFAGKVGTGFSSKQRGELRRQLEKDAVAKPSVKGAPRMRDATWVEPKLVAQVRFTEWTDDGKLRHPSFLGFRPDKSPQEVVREKPSGGSAASDGKDSERSNVKVTKTKAGSKSSSKPRSKAKATTKTKTKTKTKSKSKSKTARPKERPPAETVKLTNPGRLLYPRDGITKEDVAAYFQAVSKPMIRCLEGRPLSLEHWNQGIDRSSWFHQDVTKEAEPWMTVVDTPARTSAKSVRHFVADSPAALQWLAQRSALTVHMWSARAGSLESPDWIVFDLDPAKGKGIEQAIEGALVFRRLLEELDLPSVPKTSGKRGIHVFVPLVPGYSHEDALEFACRIADGVASQVPDFTTERSLSKRKGRLYVDCLQNGYGKTIVAPYSLRASDGAPVSAPLEWSEVTPKLDPSKFNLRTMPERLAKKGDLFRRALEGGAQLPRLR